MVRWPVSSPLPTPGHLAVSRTVFEIGSGLNRRRPKLIRLLADLSVQTIVVEHGDGLMRFGCEYVETALAAQGRRSVAAEAEMKEDLVQDMVEVFTSFCARLYGRRSARNRAKKAIEVVKHDRAANAASLGTDSLHPIYREFPGKSRLWRALWRGGGESLR
jgi:predicted site-specific integrase-resolvase